MARYPHLVITKALTLIFFFINVSLGANDPLGHRVWRRPIWLVVFVFNVPPTAKIIWRQGHCLKSHPTAWLTRGIEPATPGLQGKQFIHYTTAAPTATNLNPRGMAGRIYEVNHYALLHTK